MPTEQSVIIDSPLGRVEITGNEQWITSVGFTDAGARPSPRPNEHLVECAVQIAEYFEFGRESFENLPLLFEDDSFTTRVWQHLSELPFGSISTYSQVAADLAKEKAVRAVGSACRKNPFVIVIPCHRILPSDLSVGNYAYGSNRKEWLLEHEERHLSERWIRDFYLK